ncbi:hypothetical protein JHK86_034993 [Glycine max]|nr:hypothetical protein JHK86_034993 [Glycine max]
MGRTHGGSGKRRNAKKVTEQKQHGLQQLERRKWRHRNDWMQQWYQSRWCDMINNQISIEAFDEANGLSLKARCPSNPSLPQTSMSPSNLSLPQTPLSLKPRCPSNLEVSPSNLAVPHQHPFCAVELAPVVTCLPSRGSVSTVRLRSSYRTAGLYADMDFKEGELVLKDPMLVGAQHPLNKLSISVLNHQVLGARYVKEVEDLLNKSAVWRKSFPNETKGDSYGIVNRVVSSSPGPLRCRTQEPGLIIGTILDNIVYRKNASEDEVRKAYKKGNNNDVVMPLIQPVRIVYCCVLLY